MNFSKTGSKIFIRFISNINMKYKMKFPEKKYRTYAFLGIILITLGQAVPFIWEILLTRWIINEMVLTNISESYKLWKEPPIAMHFSVYLFNWTNAEEVLKTKWNVKPVFQECGPYVFTQNIKHLDVTWNDNGTVTFREKYTWRFSPSRSKGNLNDKITTLNTIAAVLGNKAKDRNLLIRQATNWVLNRFEKSLVLTKTANELLFAGYEDKILKIASKLNISSLSMFSGKFGWFYFVNDSATIQGTSTMYTGQNNIDLLGKMNMWNGQLYTNSYEGNCGLVNGTSGELFPPLKNDHQISIFSPDICSAFTLQHQVDESVNGLSGKKFVGTDYAFDNGSKYLEQTCFRGKKMVPSGTRDVSKCKFGAPAFISYPHFYLADPSYRRGIVGMRPNKAEHEFYLILEPNTGIPLDARIQMQINLFTEPVPSIKMFADVKPTYIPILWFRQEVTLPRKYCYILLVLCNMGMYAGCILFCLGICFVTTGLYLFFQNGWKDKKTELLIEEE